MGTLLRTMSPHAVALTLLAADEPGKVRDCGAKSEPPIRFSLHVTGCLDHKHPPQSFHVLASNHLHPYTHTQPRYMHARIPCLGHQIRDTLRSAQRVEEAITRISLLPFASPRPSPPLP